jgi:hypothetical protein
MLLAGAGGVTKLSLQNGTYDPCHGIGTGSALLISIVTALPMIPIYGGAARPSTAPSRERRGFSFVARTAGLFFWCRPPIRNLAWPPQRIEWQDSHCTWLDWGDRQCMAPLSDLGNPRAGPFFVYTCHSRLAEASSKQAWHDHFRTITYPDALPRR